MHVTYTISSGKFIHYSIGSIQGVRGWRGMSHLNVDVVAEHGADLVEVLEQRHHVLGGALLLVQQVVLQLVHLSLQRVQQRLHNHVHLV